MDSLKTLIQPSPPGLASGRSRKEVYGALVAAGWSQHIAQEYIEKSFAANTESSLISVSNISKAFGGNKVLHNVSLDIRQGEILGVIGLSGAGKTTLLNLLVGFLKPESGDIVVHLSNSTFSVYSSPETVKHLFGFSTQTPSFYGKLTVFENIAHFASLYGYEPAECLVKANELMQTVGLLEFRDSLAQNLSGGMQKRLDIACALIHNPAYLILDEPTADLDPLRARQVWDVIKRINAQGTTIIVSSHFLEDMERVCSRIAIIHEGKIAALGTPHELSDTISGAYHVNVSVRSGNYAFLENFINSKNLALSSQLEEGGIVFETKRPKEVLLAVSTMLAKSGDALENVSVKKPGVSELFEKLVKS